MHEKLKPFPYQLAAGKWLAARETAILADEMGVGKTFSAIIGADLTHSRNILVICPGIARENWVREFDQCQRMDRTLACIQSAKVLPTSEVVVTSFSLARNERVWTYLHSRQWDAMIIDEGHYLKNPNARQTKFIYGAKCNRAGLSGKSKRVWVLSGTIMPNHPGELYPHMNALFPAVVKNRTYNQWVDRYCIRKSGSDAVVGPKAEHKGELVQALRPNVLRRLSQDVQKDLPSLRTSRVVVRPDSLPTKSREIEETEVVVRAALAKAEKGDSDAAREAMQAIQEIHLASLRRWTGIAKAPAIAEFINEELANGLDKIVIFAIHTDVINTLNDMIPGSAAISGKVPLKERQRAIDAFQGKVPGYNPRVIIIQLEMGSTAITLTASCNVAFAEFDYVPKNIEQAMKRCHRQGQTRSVLARLFALAGSVDEDIARTILRKTKHLTEFNSALVTRD